MDGNPLKLVPIVSGLEKLEAKNQCCVSGMVYSGSSYEFFRVSDPTHIIWAYLEEEKNAP